MQQQILTFLTRWLANGLGLALAAAVGILSVSGGIKTYIGSALILALLNAIIKPVLVILTLPLITLTLGFFLLIINGTVLYLLDVLFGSIKFDNFIYAMLAGIVIGLVNYIVTILFERYSK